ncbi:hypothetical protein B0T17DRAFT_486815, partial [Bombardia bombarda]
MAPIDAPVHYNASANGSSGLRRSAEQERASTATRPNVRADHVSPIVQGLPLINVAANLPDKFRAIFPYEFFNAVQSKSFDSVYRSNDNLVVSAPTGSGKTAILELAICKLALDRNSENFKIVYQAPTKALCSERSRDWASKFGHMGLKCAELTGDTSQAEMRRVGDASIIVTTPEKWDSITRKWGDHRKLLQLVELFLIDEVHILKDARGATLEAVVSRMKTIGGNVRFVALSATVPNSDDIAQWLGRNHTNPQVPAHRETFGEELRPVKLQKFVYGYECKGNDFIFDKLLDSKLPAIIARHTSQKPMLIFCLTRKICESTAKLLAEQLSGQPAGSKLWPVPSRPIPVTSREIQDLVKFGVAFHHAGLDFQDRIAVEKGFLDGELGVICCTSTLAMGVNLPCHTVILKGTVGYVNDSVQELSDLEIMQMLGRAGRPQFDQTATAIILTRAAFKDKYEKMVSGQEILESTLHLNLIEHLNSEICLGTIHDKSSAKIWLGGTFLSVRLRRNPNHYQIVGTNGMSNSSLIDDRLEEICEREIRQLQTASLVTENERFICTEYGFAMSKYMVQFVTMKLLLQIPQAPSMGTLASLLQSHDTLTQTHHKISLIIQASLGCVEYPELPETNKVKRQIMMEKKLVFERLQRLVRAVIDCKGYDRDAIGTRHALELARSLSAESWEGRPMQLTQIPNIGPAGMRKLASKNFTTVLGLADMEPEEIERAMSRQAPFGKKVKDDLDKFPRLGVNMATTRQQAQSPGKDPILNISATLRYLNSKGVPNWRGRVQAVTFTSELTDGTLIYFWRGSMRKLAPPGFQLKFSATLKSFTDRIVCHLSCEELVGTIEGCIIPHNLPKSAFPIQTTTVTSPAPDGGVLHSNSQDYWKDDGLDDADLIEAAKAASVFTPAGAAPVTATLAIPQHTPKFMREAVSGFRPVVPALVSAPVRIQQPTKQVLNHSNPVPISEPEHEPVMLPNGRYQCNHACSGGLTKAGKKCQHRCCQEGVEKAHNRPKGKKGRKAEDDISRLAKRQESQF